ncbi:MAG: tetratricopeptide repeat protein, partial [Elusimicrobiota bacterium]|nr:tetratricopeptide repeat protein [Elusimicrobiota bacterium]
THEAMRHYYRGRVFESTGEIDIAIEEYRKSIELGADYADIHNSLGRVYAKKGQFELAISEFRQALTINPHYLEAQRNLTELETRLALLKSEKMPKAAEEKAPERPSIFIPAAVALMVVIIIGIFIPKLLLQKKPIVYTSPSENISGISQDNKNLWLCDWFKQEIYQAEIVKDKLKVNRTYQLSDVSPIGILATKSFLWTCDSWAKKIYKHTYDDKLTVIGTYDSPGTTPGGICFDGKNLWTIDTNTKKIYRHNISDANLLPEASFISPCSRPVGFFYAGKYYWTVDGDKQVVFKHNKDMSVVKEYKLNLGGKKISGVFIDENFLWIAFEGEQQITRFPRSQLLK